MIGVNGGIYKIEISGGNPDTIKYPSKICEFYSLKHSPSIHLQC